MLGIKWSRLGGISGLVFFVLVIASFFTPDAPDADDPTSEIAASIADDRRRTWLAPTSASSPRSSFSCSRRHFGAG
jgi:hypothetical protein